MSRRLLGPVGGPIVFFLVAALVFGGLGWVTYAALGVEQAQREAAARAELGANLRVALWRLDGRMLPALGVEDSRPFYHYVPADPNTLYGAAATPLLTADLPDWMKLHFQLDPAAGWESPQVPGPAVAERIRLAWPDLPLRNLDPSREQVLAAVKAKFPVLPTCNVFAARALATQDDSLPLAAPLITGELTPPFQVQVTPSPIPPAAQTPLPPPSSDPAINSPAPASNKPTPDTIHFLGYELCLSGDLVALDNNSQVAPPHPVQQPQYSYPNSRAARTQKELENNRSWLDLRNRAETIGRGLKDAKGQYGGAYGPMFQNPAQLNQQIIANNSQTGATTTNPLAGNGGGAIPGGAPILGAGGFGGSDRFAGRAEQEKLARDRALMLKLRDSEERALFGVAGGLATLSKLQLQRREADKAARDTLKGFTETADALRTFGWLGECLREELLRQKAIDEAKKANQKEAGEKASDPTVRMGPPRPLPADEVPPIPPAEPVALPPALPITVHLGSMRPQWVTAPDGSDMLVLVRAAKLDNKTVYQGVVLDWARLRAALKDEVKDLFPDATLVPVKDGFEVSPDRAMTALPVQLDPGSDLPLAPAGWTPLRIGLLLAWAAAIIAFAAVGFTGWSLIDLAERRIKFVSAVTHELRTPLTSLRLYLDLLVSGMIQDEAKRQEYLKTLTIESDRLHRLIDNVLDFAKLEKRRKNGVVKPVKVGDLLGQLRQTWTDRVAQDGKELVVLSTLPPEQEVVTDAGMVQQIVGNLIDNARKYAREAADHRIWVWAKPGSGKGIVIEVEDRGPGVPAGERRTIFKPFRRGEQADSKAGGAGLGLALAKSWAEVLGGHLTYRPADDGTGSCFRLELPGK